MTQTKKKKEQGIPTQIIWTARILERLNPAWASQFAIHLFATPIRHKWPKREHELLASAITTDLQWNGTAQRIRVYQWGTGAKKALVVHGWSGRGTQLVRIINALVTEGFTVYSYDAPAHGASDGKKALMTDFVKCNHLLHTLYGPFDACIGHSLGSMSLFNAISEGLPTKCFVGIGSGNSVWHIIELFVKNLQLQPKMVDRIIRDIERKYQLPKRLVDYSAFSCAPKIDLPVLMIHDIEDKEVPIGAMRTMQGKLRNLETMETKGLGHRKILGDQKVIERCMAFIQKNG